MLWMWFFASMFGYLNFSLLLIWLLTVIGSGFWQEDKKRESQPFVVQLAVTVNTVSAVDNLAERVFGVKIKGIKLIELAVGKTERKLNEGLLNCPVCQKLMEFYKIADGDEIIVYDKCPNCAAIFFDDRDFLWTIYLGEHRKKAGKTGSYECPRCQRKMRVKTSKFDPEKAVTYFCSECLGNLLV